MDDEVPAVGEAGKDLLGLVHRKLGFERRLDGRDAVAGVQDRHQQLLLGSHPRRLRPPPRPEGRRTARRSTTSREDAARSREKEAGSGYPRKPVLKTERRNEAREPAAKPLATRKRGSPKAWGLRRERSCRRRWRST
jgi:hypothetical protein